MNLTFLRRPIKLILFSIVFCLLTIAALVFTLQYKLDGIAMEEAVSKYGYVGVIYNTSKEGGLLQKLPDDIVSQISNSEYVSEVQCRKT